jgi:dynein heavy chain
MTNLNDYDMTKKPEDGCYIYGFYIEGASWNNNKKQLNDPLPKVLYPQMPYVWFKPVHKSLEKVDCYVCPVYRTSRRAGELSTTGQSTNFLINICK